MKNIQEELKEIFRENLKKKESYENIVLGQDSNWSVGNHRILIKKIEKKFNIKFSEDEITSMISFKIIYATLKSYLS